MQCSERQRTGFRLALGFNGLLRAVKVLRCCCMLWLIDDCYGPTSSAAYVLTRDSANDITITQMFITLAIMLEVY